MVLDASTQTSICDAAFGLFFGEYDSLLSKLLTPCIYLNIVRISVAPVYATTGESPRVLWRLDS